VHNLVRFNFPFFFTLIISFFFFHPCTPAPFPTRISREGGVTGVQTPITMYKILSQLCSFPTGGRSNCTIKHCASASGPRTRYRGFTPRPHWGTFAPRLPGSAHFENFWIHPCDHLHYIMLGTPMSFPKIQLRSQWKRCKIPQ